MRHIHRFTLVLLQVLASPTDEEPLQALLFSLPFLGFLILVATQAFLAWEVEEESGTSKQALMASVALPALVQLEILCVSLLPLEE